MVSRKDAIPHMSDHFEHSRWERLKYEERFRAVSNMTTATSHNGAAEHDSAMDNALEQVWDLQELFLRYLPSLFDYHFSYLMC